MFNNAIVAFGGWPGGLALAARQYAGGTDQASAPVLPQADYVSINGGAGHAKLPSGQQGDEITIGVAIAAPLTLWPPTNGKVQGDVLSVSLAAKTVTTFRCVGFNSWVQTVQVTATVPLPGGDEEPPADEPV